MKLSLVRWLESMSGFFMSDLIWSGKDTHMADNACPSLFSTSYNGWKTFRNWIFGRADVGPMNVVASGPQFVKAATAPQCFPLAFRHSSLIIKKCVSIFLLAFKGNTTASIQRERWYVHFYPNKSRSERGEERELNIFTFPDNVRT